MLRRVLDSELDELFGQVAAIAIDGPKGVGKTTTAEQRVRAVVRLDAKAIRGSISAEPEQVLDRRRRVLIDEWQEVPEVWGSQSTRPMNCVDGQGDGLDLVGLYLPRRRSW